MLASIPIVREDLIQTRVNRPYTTQNLMISPSREAAAIGHQDTISILPEKIERRVTKIDCQKISNVLTQGTPSRECLDQFDYIQLIDDIVVNFALGPEIFLNEGFAANIFLARNALHTDRTNIGKSYRVGHQSKRASDWFFTLPEYNPVESSIDVTNKIKRQRRMKNGTVSVLFDY
ncbi:hypothetical protein F4678DRAFT_442750 [Xylaria arbuscula]|nr:hypothetical protein F4678DRAFT_442750 [Xylaria arbuscula]